MLQLNFDPFPNIETDRLLMRQIKMDDAEDFFNLRTDEEAMKYVDMPRPATVEEVKVMIQKIDEGVGRNIAIGWVIALKEQPGIIGTISYHRIMREHYRAEIGYMLFPKYWGMGIMSEAIKAIIDYGFNQVGFHSIEANVNPLNDASKKLLLKLGFNLEAWFKENYFFNGKFLDTHIYSLVNK